MANFWLKLTPLETKLVLVLIISAPFLMGMIVVYCYWTTSSGYCVNCKTACKATYCASGSSYSLFDSLNETYSPPKYSFMAAIVEDIYADDVKYKRYMCSAAILSYRWVITGSYCIQVRNSKAKKFYGLFVRVGSNYWSQEGSVHQINNISLPTNDSDSPTIAAIKVRDPFPEIVTPILISTDYMFIQKSKLLLYDWLGDLMVPYQMRKKYTEVNVLEINIQRCDGINVKNKDNLFCGSESLNKSKGCKHMRGALLMKNNYLSGIEVLDFCQSNNPVYIFVQLSSYMDWLHTLN